MKKILLLSDTHSYIDAAILKQEYDLQKQNDTHINVVPNEETGNKKKRGRPKGSKNKKKSSETEPSSNKDNGVLDPIIGIDNSKNKPEVVEEVGKVGEEVVEEVKVRKFEYKGDVYLLDDNSGDIYHIETQDILGKYNGTDIDFD